VTRAPFDLAAFDPSSYAITKQELKDLVEKQYHNAIEILSLHTSNKFYAIHLSGCHVNLASPARRWEL
jgi:hypothetical protein